MGVSARKRSGKAPWPVFIAAAVIVPLILTALATLTGIGKRDDIQRDLSRRSQSALQNAGMAHAKVSFDGRDATVSGVTAGQKTKAQDVVERVDGVRVADVEPATAVPGKLQVGALNGRKVDDQRKVTKPTGRSGDKNNKNKLQGKINQILHDNPITFEPDSSALTSDGKNTVEQVASLLKDDKGAKVRVEGHVAAVPGGDPSSDQQLSEARANAVAKALSGDGVARDRVTSRGYGSSKPIADNNTPEGQAANRRVDIVVL